MKSLTTILALTIAVAVAAPSFAQTKPPAPTKVDCEKMKDKRWDEGSKTCLPK
jgi:hypothetical protein